MKKRFLFYLLIFVLMVALPSIGFFRTPSDSPLPVPQKHKQSNPSAPTKSPTDSFIILDTSTNKTVTVPDKDFCVGAVAYEMPPSFCEEALKAQCVAVYTHFCRLRQQNRQNPKSDLNGADFSADLSKHEFYYDTDTLKEKWGDNYNKDIQKMQSAVNAVYGMTLQNRDGKFIDAMYFSMSNGQTESAKAVFDHDDTHLQAVASPFDCFAPNFKSTMTLSTAEFQQKLRAEFPSMDFSSSPEQWIGNISRTPSNGVQKISVCKTEIPGTEIRKILALRSTDFTVRYADDTFTFTTYGYGHRVGMSQYGAEYMAQQGSDYRQILMHYYANCSIKNK